MSIYDDDRIDDRTTDELEDEYDEDLEDEDLEDEDLEDEDEEEDEEEDLDWTVLKSYRVGDEIWTPRKIFYEIEDLVSEDAAKDVFLDELDDFSSEPQAYLDDGEVWDEVAEKKLREELEALEDDHLPAGCGWPWESDYVRIKEVGSGWYFVGSEVRELNEKREEADLDEYTIIICYDREALETVSSSFIRARCVKKVQVEQ